MGRLNRKFSGLARLIGASVLGVGLLYFGGCEPREIVRNSLQSTKNVKIIVEESKIENGKSSTNRLIPLMFDELKIISLYPEGICLGYKKIPDSSIFIVHCYNIRSSYKNVFSLYPRDSGSFRVDSVPFSQQELLEETFKGGSKNIH